jgi:hypothetical protein
MYRLRLERMAPDSPELTAGIHMQPIGPGTRQIRVPYLPALRGTPFRLWRHTERPMSRRGVPRCRFAMCIVNRINTAVQLPGPLQRRALLLYALYAAFCWQPNKQTRTHAESHTQHLARIHASVFSRADALSTKSRPLQTRAAARPNKAPNRLQFRRVRSLRRRCSHNAIKGTNAADLGGGMAEGGADPAIEAQPRRSRRRTETGAPAPLP